MGRMTNALKDAAYSGVRTDKQNKKLGESNSRSFTVVIVKASNVSRMRYLLKENVDLWILSRHLKSAW